jgi:hypothetical protein
MTPRAVHKRAADWHPNTREAACGFTWVRHSTDDDLAVTCKRCVRMMARTPLEQREAGET